MIGHQVTIISGKKRLNNENKKKELNVYALVKIIRMNKNKMFGRIFRTNVLDCSVDKAEK